MRKGSKVALGTFVVTAVFVKTRTIKAQSVNHALQLAEEQGICDRQDDESNLSNWHAHEVDAV
jgi:hypothetical protein